MNINKSIKQRITAWIGMFSLSIAMVLTSCEPGPGRMDTTSDQDFADENNLPVTEPTDASANPAGVRADSTPAADNPDLDNNPIIDKGMSTDSAFKSEQQNKQQTKQ